MKKIFLTIILFSIVKIGIACPTFYFHLTFSGTKTFVFQNMSNPADYAIVSGTGSIDGWNFNTTLGTPCGMTFGANICYSILEVGEHLTSDEIIAIKFSGNPNHLTINYDGINKTFNVTNIGNPTTYTLTWGDNADNPPICSTCFSDVAIIDNYQYDNFGSSIVPNPYDISLTESSTYLLVADIVIPTGATVKFDADPINGYIELFADFEAQLGCVFIAECLDGCGPSVPMRFAPPEEYSTNNGKSELSTHENLSIYPNPTTGQVTVQHAPDIGKLSVYDILGKQVAQTSSTDTETHIDLSELPNGMYFLRIDGYPIQKIIKQ